MADNSDILAQISALFEASQKSNSKSTQEATKLALKQLQNQLQIAQGNNKTSRQIASGNNQSAEQIASGNNQTSLQVASGNNQSSERIASGNNQTSLQIASGNNQTSLATNAANNETQRYVSNLENQTRLQLQEKEAVAAEQQQARELASKLGITNIEQAGEMARLEKQLGVQQQDIDARLTLGREQLGFSREQLAANMQVENAKLAQAHEEMIKVGIPTMLADKWYKEQQVSLAQSAQKIDQQNANTNEGRLGFDVYSKAVDMASTAAKRYQFGDLISGLANNPNARDWAAKMGGAVVNSGFGPASDAGTQPITPQQALGDFMSMMGVPNMGAAPVGGPPAGPALPYGNLADPSYLAGVVQFMHDNGGTVADGVRWMESKPPDDPNRLGAIQQGLAHGFNKSSVFGATGSTGVPQVFLPGATTPIGATLHTNIPSWAYDQTGYADASGSNIIQFPGQAAAPAGGAEQVFAGGNGSFNEAAGAFANPQLAAFQAQQNRELGQIGRIADAGGSALMPGTLESMNPDDLAEFQSGMAKLRRDVPAWTRDYQTAGVYNAAPDKLAA